MSTKYNNLVAPDGDANPSSSSVDPPIVAAPRNDVSFSSDPPPTSSTSVTHQNSSTSNPLPESSSRNESQHAEPFFSNSNSDSAVLEPALMRDSPNHVEPFLSGDRGLGNYPVGPRSERPKRYNTDRPVHAMHIGKVIAVADKKINRALKQEAGLSDEQVEPFRGGSRKDVCHGIFSLWMQAETRNVFDLKFLLTNATANFPEEEKDKFKRIIRDIVNNPP